jgi:outer membrane protein OmpA-like peptidoglycan-associated protein
VLLLALWVTAAASAKLPVLPGYLAFLPEIAKTDADRTSFENFGEARFYPKDGDTEVVQRGRHWSIEFSAIGLPEDADGKTVWARLMPGFLKNGWVAVAEYPANPFSATLHWQKSGADAWANIQIFGAGDVRLDTVEIAAPTMTLALNPPAAAAERVVPERGDFPYLGPLPGSKFKSGSKTDAPMAITLPGSDEPQLVGSGTISKSYTAPDGLSNLLFVTVYRDGLTRAGWGIIGQSQGMNQSDAAITAHYTASGRDIWAYLHGTPGEYSITVADAGAHDLAGELAKSCHAALYGVLFDFNKASLKPDSDAVLGHVLALLQKEPGLHLDVQGHTDNVGGDSYNQKLSEGRAQAVALWLGQHGIAAGRLTALGYGKTRPVADNDSDEGRARNRRVEIAKPGCHAK